MNLVAHYRYVASLNNKHIRHFELNSFIISVSSCNDIKDHFEDMSETDFANKNIIFQEKSNYIDQMFKKITGPN